MPFEPNYRFERSERERLKKAKQDEKLRRQQARETPPGDKDPGATDHTSPANG